MLYRYEIVPSYKGRMVCVLNCFTDKTSPIKFGTEFLLLSWHFKEILRGTS